MSLWKKCKQCKQCKQFIVGWEIWIVPFFCHLWLLWKILDIQNHCHCRKLATLLYNLRNKGGGCAVFDAFLVPTLVFQGVQVCTQCNPSFCAHTFRPTHGRERLRKTPVWRRRVGKYRRQPCSLVLCWVRVRPKRKHTTSKIVAQVG